MKENTNLSEHPGFAGRMASAFIDSKLTALALIASLLLGILAVIMLPQRRGTADQGSHDRCYGFHSRRNPQGG